MGNQMTRSGNSSSKKTDQTVASGNTQTANTSSGAEIEQTSHTQFFPIDTLAKILAQISDDEERVNGITVSVFARYLFPTYPILAKRLYAYLRWSAEVSTLHISSSVFKQEAEKFLSVMNDQTVLENYIRMFSNIEGEGDVVQDTLTQLLTSAYQLAMDSNGSGSCLHIHQILKSVVASCFHGKESLSVSYVNNWIWQHCPRVVNGLHRYVVHVLTTAYRNGKLLMSKEHSQPLPNIPTPILERSDSLELPQNLLPVSYVWLLSSTLPQCYLEAINSPNDASHHALFARRTGCMYPRHWTLLYNNNQHGTGANRFLHHVLGYRGPTLLFIRAANQDQEGEDHTYCLCTAVEWHESHLYWGDEDSMGIELLPSYRVIEKGAKVLYLNTGIRGYPHGLRFGSNPRQPFISIDESFHTVSIAGAPYPIARLEVWGCGDPKLREKQLEIKKWQVKEAEKQRIVKLSASDWLDHPDRYLLELAGRASYNESNK